MSQDNLVRCLCEFSCCPRHLDLSWNQMAASGAFSLAAQLPKMRLQRLELSSNQLEAAGAKAFALALAEAGYRAECLRNGSIFDEFLRNFIENP